MGLRDLEKALDRLENAMCAADVPDWLRQEVDAFATHVAEELTERMESEERREAARRAQLRPQAN